MKSEFCFYPFIVFSGYICSVISITNQEVCKTTVRCFKCDSRDNKYCEDPFNKTGYFHQHLVDVDTCKEGCCMKLTAKKPQNANNTNNYVIRSCSSRQDYRIEGQLMAHVCIDHWRMNGTLCFCEEDLCNGALNLYSKKDYSSTFTTIIFLAVILSTFSR